MANYETLKAAIQSVVKTNGNNEITGALLQQSLLAMINSLGSGYQFVDVATTATKPGTPDQKVFYIANGKGTYTNFGGISITEDEVVILYYDTAWRKLLTGIASQAKLTELRELIGEKANEADLATVAKTGKYADLVNKPTTLSGYGITDAYTKTKTDELLNTKQNELTLTVKDNGNIVIGNIQGQTKEFMPATPSGDPMHYAYVTAGAEYNDTGADIVKTAPWADMIDDDYTGDYGKTVVHKAGYWYLNGLGNLTNKSMQNAYTKSILCYAVNQSMRFYNGQTNFNFFNFMVTNPVKGENNYGSSRCKTILMNDNLYANRRLENGSAQFYNATNLLHIIGSFSDNTNLLNNCFNGCNSLITLKFYGLKHNVSFSDSPNLSIKSVLYMINGEAATSPITITLHADAYNRCMANADILAALEAHPNVSLASA